MCNGFCARVFTVSLKSVLLTGMLVNVGLIFLADRVLFSQDFLSSDLVTY